MLQYYDERATEYEEAYVLGTGTSSIPNPEVFRAEATILEQWAGKYGLATSIEHFGVAFLALSGSFLDPAPLACSARPAY
jgi:hypothetical protein